METGISPETIEFLRTFGLVLAGFMIFALVIGSFLLGIVVWQARKIDVPPGADFAETLLYTPFLIVVVIDLLDFALDLLAAPLSWVVLDRLGLKALRGVGTVQGLLPFTQLIPVMTLSWIGVRVIGVDRLRSLRNGVMRE
ncbi:MAG TPA: hypothetical protein ENJ93_03830 [Chloroflexi bacterium]|nr:hypothetical protein [Chloroflexota bacterium]